MMFALIYLAGVLITAFFFGCAKKYAKNGENYHLGATLLTATWPLAWVIIAAIALYDAGQRMGRKQ